jgi:alpha-ketoglutarate-dependent taurine dioxygenase
MFFGDDAELTDAQLKEMDEVTMRNTRYVKMREGDVVLLDNYKTMHGRNVFDGTRKHGGTFRRCCCRCRRRNDR